MQPSEEENANEQVRIDEQRIINLLCEWATTTKRSGMQRIYIVVMLLRKKQAYDIIEKVNLFI